MRVFLICILTLFLTSCNRPLKNPYALSEKQIQARQVIKEAMIQLKKDKELYPFGTAACMLNQIKLLGLSFHYYKPVDIDIARELLAYSTTLFMNIINESESIRPYLQNYPFRPENIEITIYLLNPDGSKPALDELLVVEMIGGKLKYLIKNLETQRFTTVYQETFEEATAKLQEKITI